MSQTLVIVGAGFSGIVAFYRLLNSTQQRFSRIILIDDGKAGGLAYGHADDLHLLNVPAGRMSALVENDNHFLQFARYVSPSARGSDFLPRRVYGAYLRWMLETSNRKAPEGVKASYIRDRAVDICIGRNGVARVVLQSGKSLTATKVIIATGNQQAGKLRVPTPGLEKQPYFIAHPWPVDNLRQLTTAAPTVLIGSGLTAIDIALSLHKRRPDQSLFMLSRHGLLPQAHRGLSSKSEADIDISAILTGPAGIRQMLRAVRQKVREVEHDGGDWRDVVAALRHHTPLLWQQLNAAERKRFLRHGRAYWDVHRHRLSPEVAEKLQQLQQQGLLKVEAAKILDIQRAGDDCIVSFRQRATGRKLGIGAGAVIDCTGPETRIADTGNSLLQSLGKRGLISEDTLQLGLRVADNYAVLDANGRASDVIHYVGPWLRSQYWEATAVPELREHVARLVDAICIELPSHKKSITAGHRASGDDAECCD